MKETVMTADFIGKTALVTGAGRGISRAVAPGLGVIPADIGGEEPSCAAPASR
jgi:hypothetical protein